MDVLVEELIRIKDEGAGAVLITVVESEALEGLDSGSKYLVRDGCIVVGAVSNAELEEMLLREAGLRLSEERSRLVSMETKADGRTDLFFEVMPSPPKLIVVGAGHIAVPLVKIAKLMDYYTVVIDDRILFANHERFPDADEVVALGVGLTRGLGAGAVVGAGRGRVQRHQSDDQAASCGSRDSTGRRARKDRASCVVQVGECRAVGSTAEGSCRGSSRS